MFRRLALPLLVGSAALAAACADAPPPAYLRLDGAAPPLLRALVPADAPPTLIAFWATWCPPCIQETPALRQLALDPPVGLRVMLLSQDETAADVERYFDGDLPAQPPVRVDLDQRIAEEAGVNALPTTLLVADGRLIARFDGPRRWDSDPMRRLLTRLVEERRPSGTLARPTPAPSP